MEKEKKKTNKKLIVTVVTIIIILIIIGATIGGICGYNLMQKALLTSEINNITTNIDLTKDTIDTEQIITSGDYAKVEKAVKTYLNECGTEMQKMITIIQDERLTKLLSTENYEEDGPEFNETLTYIEETSKQLNESLEKVVKLMDKDEMLNYIESYELKNKYKELYKELMLDDETEKDLKENKEELQNSITELLDNLNVSKEIINFLKQNKAKWYISNNMVMFSSTKLVDEYNELVDKLK